MTTLLRRYPWVPSLLVGVLWLVATIEARERLQFLEETVAQLAARPAVARPVRATHVWHGVAEASMTVRQIGEHRFEIPRSLLETWLGDFSRLSRTSRIVPEIRDARATGFRLYSIRPESPFHQLGFHNGDILRAINGLDLTTPERALEIYARLKTSNSFLVALDRDGERITNSYRIY